MELAIIEKMAQIGTKSGLFGIKNADQAAALMLIAQAEGISPALALRDYHVIQGRPTLKADAMLARFQAAGGRVKWTKLTDEEVSGIFSHTAGGDCEISWTMVQAKRANLTGKDVWRQYPRAMLRSRCISEGIRSVFPGVICGVYTPEEIENISVPTEQAPAPVIEDAEIIEDQKLPDVGYYVALIESSETMDDLKTNFGQAYKSVQEKDRQTIIEAKDERKAQLELM